MLLHLPIVILATPSPTAVSDQVPKFDIARECRYEGGGATDIDRCSRDESTALEQLKTQWTQFGDADKRGCVSESSEGGVASYVELLICLEMTSEVQKDDHSSRAQGPGTDTPPPQRGQPGVTVGVGQDSIRRTAH